VPSEQLGTNRPLAHWTERTDVMHSLRLSRRIPFFDGGIIAIGKQNHLIVQTPSNTSTSVSTPMPRSLLYSSHNHHDFFSFIIVCSSIRSPRPVTPPSISRCFVFLQTLALAIMTVRRERTTPTMRIIAANVGRERLDWPGRVLVGD
jgi:hypothetical protein